jgi:hypothetical protein
MRTCLLALAAVVLCSLAQADDCAQNLDVYPSLVRLCMEQQHNEGNQVSVWIYQFSGIYEFLEPAGAAKLEAAADAKLRWAVIASRCFEKSRFPISADEKKRDFHVAFQPYDAVSMHRCLIAHEEVERQLGHDLTQPGE